MTALSEGVFTSKLFTFFVGQDKKAITIHSAVIAKYSHALCVLMNGVMSEAERGEAVLEDVDESTFIRFCQFVYSGDYETPLFTESDSLKPSTSGSVPPSPGDGPSEVIAVAEAPELGLNLTQDSLGATISEEPAVPFDDWSNWAPATKKLKNRDSKIVRLRRELGNRVYDISIARSETLENFARCEVRQNKLPKENYTPVLLGHAGLYVFAEKWGVEALKTLTLHKIHRTLITFSLFETRRTDILELAKFAYSNENTPDLDGEIDKLRELIIHYITCNLQPLNRTSEFNELLEQQGQFSRDLVKMMMRLVK